MPTPDLFPETKSSEALEEYAQVFALYRNRYPRLTSPQDWRENGKLDSWAHEMVAAVLLPGWLAAGGSEKAFAALRKDFVDDAERNGWPESPHWPSTNMLADNELAMPTTNICKDLER
ncbi:MAG: hypothetical protein M0Z50_02695 [Planctomycetia bacterium]|nr:hypothetical protein [Planctomycetia bacterium]